ncbi:uncharacterized protein LOC123722924 [Papilio machaon]|uniref:uncharacterized protein LOC123722924 n=1 Tax=Papilio machaon TaxID=76193 RepID=UPI001E66441C|nr:uncharacterized protein LOC123722924 [Papilio machaon]
MTQVLLATALIKAQTRQGSTQLLRVLLDQGSQASFITHSAVQLLGLKRTPTRSVISGIGGERGVLASEHTVNVTIHSHLDSDFSLQINAYVLSNITSLLPSVKVVPWKWPELEAISLADPEFHTPNRIDILLGADAYAQVLGEGLVKGPPGGPIAQNTALGWILSDKISSTGDSISCHHAVISYPDQADENALLKQFWEIESVIPGTQKILSEEELRCEEFYSQTTRRDEDGRYVVKLPFRDDDPKCQYENTKALALKRFLHLEQKFQRNPEIAKRYSEVFHEYKELGHVEHVPEDDREVKTAVYLPHHAVIREDKSTTKVRIVFDASMKGANGSSLNTDLMVGPTLQPPLRHILMKWRMHPISLCCDIVKMYRQVKIAPEDADFQRIVWRDSPSSEMEEYKLVTVTFGTASAPYLAVKTLQQIAVDEGARSPEVAEKIKKDYYVDDLMSGCQTVEEGVKIYKDMTEILAKGGFQLQKWVSSCKELEEEISRKGSECGTNNEEERSIDGGIKDISIDKVMKILGITWDRRSDEFKYAVNLPTSQGQITKRKTDSSVVLAWLSSHPSRWTTFVGNRVSTILSNFENNYWAHVQSAENPADLASRGITPQELSESVLWAQGPSWLLNDKIEYKRPRSIATNLEKRSVKTHLVTENTQDITVWTKFSKLKKLLRVIAYCRRVLKWKGIDKQNNKKRYELCLQNEEIEEARKVCIRHVQNQQFKEEIIDLKRIGRVKEKSKLKCLCPFIDKDGILRVSGRIENAQVEMSAKHPIILPRTHHFTNLVIDEAHQKTLHGGPTLMLCHLRSQFWIISAKSLVKAWVRNCVKCKRYAVSNQNQLMGQLPPCRITPARPFKHCGVDFAGPINIRVSKGRGHHSYKGYICVFVCMVTKAIHLEAISDLIAQGFIAGFKRFVARRGLVSDMWSDNGTNFVGAAKELQHLVEAEKSSVAVEIRQWLGNNGTSWHFIPPHAPNFGGLWEAGVKATKGHLKRVYGDSTLTFEEISTVLAQIEACLNSRPLSMLSDDPKDPTPQTPGHFLIGEPLLTVPDRSYEDAKISSLRRWQVTQRMIQQFWKRWSSEYLTHLSQRYKWTKHTPEPKIGDIVLVKENGLPPARWLLGRVVTKYPGDDQITRVVALKCNGSIIKRPTSNLIVLPVAQ